MAWAKKVGDIIYDEYSLEMREIENLSPIIMQLLYEFGDDFFGRTFYGRRKYKVKRINYNQWRSELRGRDWSLMIEKVLWGDYWRIDLKTGDRMTRAVSLAFKREQNIIAFGFALTSELSKVFSEWRK
jgi:hypothetical protein